MMFVVRNIVSIASTVFFVSFLSTISQGHEEAHHPCDRVCTPEEPSMLCPYNFILSLSRNMKPPRHANLTEEREGDKDDNPCGRCPQNLADCYKVHCMTADGLSEKKIYLINNLFPGPSVKVCQGDDVIVNVTNNILSGESVTLHWHGIHQIGTPYMDGTPMITQCPIIQGTTYQYKFRATESGTKFYHAHESFIKNEGAVGSLIIRPKVSAGNLQKVLGHFGNKTYKIVRSSKIKRRRQLSSEVENVSIDNSTSTDFNFNKTSESIQTNRISKDIVPIPEPPITADSYLDFYDFSDEIDRDKGNVLIVQEWQPDSTSMHYMRDEEDASSILINGKQGTRPESPPSILFLKGSEYTYPLLRIISNGYLYCPIQTRLEGYKFWIIALDGNVLVRDEDSDRLNQVDVLTIFPGERIDVLLVKDHAQDIMNDSLLRIEGQDIPRDVYAMHWRSVGDCQNEHMTTNATSLIVFGHYHENETDGEVEAQKGLIAKAALEALNGKESSKSLLDAVWGDMDNLKVFNPAHEVDFNLKSNYVRLNDLKGSSVSDDLIKTSLMNRVKQGKADRNIYLFTDSYLLDDDVPMFNNVSFLNPSAPLLSQFSDVQPKELCNLETRPRCSREFCSCTHMYEIELGSVIDIVLIDEGLIGEYDIHTIHLHGYNFAVLGQEKLNKTTSFVEVKDLDKVGLLQRNFENVIVKDTVSIPEGGYTVIRVEFDNPGFWMLHCHLSVHLLKGMALIFKVGNIETDMPPVPANFPKCGSYYHPSPREQQET